MEVDSPPGEAAAVAPVAAVAASGSSTASVRGGAAGGASPSAGGLARASTGGTGASEKYEWVKVPAPVVRHERLRLLCSVLRLEACSDSSFQVGAGEGAEGGSVVVWMFCWGRFV